jgi:nucleotidyltransferase substrate binding protein (TIGR01987 family)
MKMQLDFSPLQKAIDSLNKAIHRASENPHDEELRDAVIQRFEYTYELTYKMLKRQLSKEAANLEIIDRLSFRDLLREAAQKGLIDNIDSWLVYRDQRNITSHTYDANKAEQVRATAYKFANDAEILLATLLRRSP